MQVLLVEAPPQSLLLPSLSLPLLSSLAVSTGADCRVLYLNHHFASRIGPREYQTRVAETDPTLLVADRIAKGLGDQDLVHAFYAACDDLAASICAVDILGFSLNLAILPAIHMMHVVRDRFPQALMVVGGANVHQDSARHLLTLFPDIDVALVGECETSWPKILREFPSRDYSAVPGAYWRDSQGRLCETTPAIVGEAVLDDMPAPRFDDWALSVKSISFEDRSPVHEFARLPVEMSRGCWWGEMSQCLFCGINGRHLDYRQVSVARVSSCLDNVREANASMVHFTDSICAPHNNFERIRALNITNRGIHSAFLEVKPPIPCDALATLRDSGITTIQAGIESLSTPALVALRKGHHAWQNVLLLRDAASLGISVMWNFLFGIPGEEPSWYRCCPSLIEALSHLQPARTLRQVRADRGSPLFYESRSEIFPAPAYFEIFPSQTSVEDIAYFFCTPPVVPYDDVNAALASWRSVGGLSSLVRLSSDKEHVIVDRRPMLSTNYLGRLDSFDTFLFNQSRTAPYERTIYSRNDGEGRRRLNALRDRNWLVKVDNRIVDVTTPFRLDQEKLTDAVAEMYSDLYMLMMDRMCNRHTISNEAASKVGAGNGATSQSVSASARS